MLQPLQLHPGIYQKIDCMISLTTCHATVHLSWIWHMILMALPLDSAYLSVCSDTQCVLLYTQKSRLRSIFLDVLQFAGDGLMERHKTAPGEAVTKVLANIETWKMRLIHMVCADQKS